MARNADWQNLNKKWMEKGDNESQRTKKKNDDGEELYGYVDSSRRAEKDRTKTTIGARRRFDKAKKRAEMPDHERHSG